jgi:hypothetical protein
MSIEIEYVGGSSTMARGDSGSRGVRVGIAVEQISVFVCLRVCGVRNIGHKEGFAWSVNETKTFLNACAVVI